MICFEDHWSSARGRSLWLSVICISCGAADSIVCLKSSSHCSIQDLPPGEGGNCDRETESLRHGTEKEKFNWIPITVFEFPPCLYALTVSPSGNRRNCLVFNCLSALTKIGNR